MASLAIATIAAVVIGTGVSAYGQYVSGQQQEAIAQFNAAQREREAQIQTMSMQTQAALQKQEAERNFQLRTADAEARFGNARAIENQALTQDAINRANLRKRREDFARLQGEQRAMIAAAGVAEASGTPLDLLAEMNARVQQDQEEQHYAGENQRRTLFSEANAERFGGKLALVGATIDRDSSVTAAGLREAAGKASYLAGLREAQITRMAGRAARTNANYQAAGTLFSGASSATGSAYRYKKDGAFDFETS